MTNDPVEPTPTDIDPTVHAVDSGDHDPTDTSSIGRTLEIIGDRWTMLVLRDAFRGIHRFDEFRRDLGIARPVLSDRLRKLVGDSVPEFAKATTRHHNELTGNANMGRGLDHFTEGISDTIKRSAKRLKPGRPFAFTYHHNQLEAYLPLAVAILDAELVCSASLPCPAEMGASIHINGTGSSVIDTVFVCRTTGRFPKRWLAADAQGLAAVVRRDIEMLRDGGLKATQGDIRCICCGHLTRLAIWNLRTKWDSKKPVMERMKAIRQWYADFGGLGAVLTALEKNFANAERSQHWAPAEILRETYEPDDEVSF